MIFYVSLKKKKDRQQSQKGFEPRWLEGIRQSYLLVFKHEPSEEGT